MTRTISRLLSAVAAVPVLLFFLTSPLNGSPLQQADDGSALYEALNNERPDLVRSLLEQGADADARGPDGTPILIAAAANGDTAIVAALLAHGADANVLNAEGYTPLMAATEFGESVEVVIALLGAGADVNASMEGWSALWGALDSGNPEIIDVLLAHGADVNGALPTSMDVQDLCGPGQWACPGTTLLMLSSGGGMTEFVETLLTYGADLAAQDAGGRNALSYAEEGGHSDIAGILRDAGVPELEEVSRDPTEQPAYTLFDLGALGVRLEEVAGRMDEVPSAQGQPESEGRREWEISINLIAQAERLDTRLEALATAYYLSELASDENAETAWYIYHAWTRSVFDFIGEQAEWFCEDWGRGAKTATVIEGVTEFCAIGRELRHLLSPALENLD